MTNQFATRLKELIEESGKMQKDICADLHISKQKLSKWKTRYNEPSLDELCMLSLYFDVSADVLLGLADETGERIKGDRSGTSSASPSVPSPAKRG